MNSPRIYALVFGAVIGCGLFAMMLVRVFALTLTLSAEFPPADRTLREIEFFIPHEGWITELRIETTAPQWSARIEIHDRTDASATFLLSNEKPEEHLESNFGYAVRAGDTIRMHFDAASDTQARGAVRLTLKAAGQMLQDTPPQSAVAIIGDCAYPNKKAACFDALEKRVLSLPFSAREQFFDEALRSLTFAGMCHEFQHRIGEAYVRTHAFVDALLECTTHCSDGCYHGVAEAYVKSRAARGEDVGAARSTIEECRTSSSCAPRMPDAAHGIGHAFMFLFDNDRARALDACTTIDPPHGCYAGVFMSEHATRERTPHAAPPIPDCALLRERYQEQCFISHADFFLTGTVAENIEVCRAFPAFYRPICYERVGITTARSAEPGALSAICARLDRETRDQCLRGIIRRATEEKRYAPEALLPLCEMLSENAEACSANLQNRERDD